MGSSLKKRKSSKIKISLCNQRKTACKQYNEYFSKRTDLPLFFTTFLIVHKNNEIYNGMKIKQGYYSKKVAKRIRVC